MYVKGTDTYTVLFYQRPKITSEIKSVVEDVYVDQLAETHNKRNRCVLSPTVTALQKPQNKTPQCEKSESLG